MDGSATSDPAIRAKPHAPARAPVDAHWREIQLLLVIEFFNLLTWIIGKKK